MASDVDEFISEHNIELADDEIHDWLAECWEEAATFTEEKLTSTNNARDEICSKNVCSYCRNICICQGNAEFPKCFDGKKLSPVA